MRISILTPDLSHNCLGRAYVLAQLLERNHEVEIIGPQFEESIWEPLSEEYNYKAVKTNAFIHSFLGDIPDILKKISGDIVYVSKPKLSSYGIGMIKSIKDDIPLILDIDDWESGLHYDAFRPVTYVKGLPLLVKSNSFYYTRMLELTVNIADAHTVSNQYLKDKYGGTIIPHARDTTQFYPEKFDKQDSRRELGLPLNKFLVVFSGTPRPYKGVEELVRALVHIDHPNIKGVIVGAHDSKYVKRLEDIGGDSLIMEGKQPFSEIPRWIAAADIIVTPQRDTLATRGQLPAKVFDAMAMAKPIIATNASNLPTVLDGCGHIVDPEEPAQLREAIVELFLNESLREEMGQSARRRCIEQYSYDAVAPILDKVVLSVANKQI